MGRDNTNNNELHKMKQALMDAMVTMQETDNHTEDIFATITSVSDPEIRKALSIMYSQYQAITTITRNRIISDQMRTYAHMLAIVDAMEVHIAAENDTMSEKIIAFLNDNMFAAVIFGAILSSLILIGLFSPETLKLFTDITVRIITAYKGGN